MAKLNKEQVKIIKYLLKNSDLLQREIAEIFGVSRESISGINRGKTWKTV